VRALIVLLALASCSGSNAAVDPRPGAPAGSLRVLFIGNSLTYVNDLPGTVAQLAASRSPAIEVASVAHPNFALIDHAEGLSNALEIIAQGGWDYVVLQQGPSALPLSRDTLVIATRLLDAHINAAGGRSALLMVWPESSRFAVFDDVRNSYRLAAAEVGGLFLPAGEAWRAAWGADPQLLLYGPDGYHPSELGTYIAALVVYEGITGKDARSLPGEAIVAGHKLSVPESRIRLLQKAAHETVARVAGE
jgi:hypothetical protein